MRMRCASALGAAASYRSPAMRDGVDLMPLGEADDLGQDGFLLVEAAAAFKCLADVPVGGVQETSQ